MTKPVDETVAALLLEYARTSPTPPLEPSLSLRRDLAIDSLSLVSVTLRLGDEYGVDIVERGVDLSSLETIGDLKVLGHALAREAPLKAEEEE